jgi:hypothetical protein
MRKQCLSLISAIIFANLCAVGTAEANGTLRVTFKLKRPDNTEQGLPYAYVYLRDAAVAPPMEKFFSPPDYIFGPTNHLGQINVEVPQGQYFVRVTRRNPYFHSSSPLGPPERGDYSWTPISPITITSNTVADLGTQYAESFGGPPIKISGLVKDIYGKPASNRYVRAQTEPCILGTESSDPNKCGPVKLLAKQRTDANGAYSMTIRNSGSYYIVVSSTLGPQTTPNYITMGKAIGPVTVREGEDITLPDIIH